MEGINRRRVLRGAVIGGVLLGQAGIARGLTDLKDLEGREIQRPADPANMTGLEKAHLVTIDAPQEITAGEPFAVSVALPNHPMLSAHHIVWMRVLLDNDTVCYTTLAPVWQRPSATFTFVLAKPMRLDVVAECNLHGLWGPPTPVELKMAAMGGTS